MVEPTDFAQPNRFFLSLVHKLCSSLVPQNDNFDKICGLSVDLLRQKKVPIGECEEQYILSKIRQLFLRDGRLEDYNNFEALYLRLKSSVAKSVNVGELLYTLFMLSNLNSKPNVSLISSSNTIQRLRMPSYDLALGDEKVLTEKSEVVMRRNAHHAPSRPHTIHGEINRDYKMLSKYNTMAKDLLVIFQGQSGRHINFHREKFVHIERSDLFDQNDICFAKRLSLLGQNFKQIKQYSAATMNNSTKGFVCQSFGSALDEEINDFYRLMTSIQANYHKGDSRSSEVTLHKLQVWTYETFIKFEALSNLIAKCRQRKGGALVSVVYDLMHHGDPIVRECIRKILSKVVKPIRQMLNHWIFYGELRDEYKEFFICINDTAQVTTSLSNAFWFNKYSINKAMLPGFISKQQAYKILITGKAISMMREVSMNRVAVILPAYDHLKSSFETSNLETLFGQKNSARPLLEYVSKEISQTALNILSAKYTLNEHFMAFKRYLLFEQGDFINYLMELLFPIIRPGSKPRLYTLSQTLENTIRKTSAQHDSSEIISRLDIHLDYSIQHDNVWDIFALKYRIDGPIGTIFNDQSQMLYSKVFMLFWKVKRVEFLLNNSWVNSKPYFKNIEPESFQNIFKNFCYQRYQILSYIKTIQRYFNYLLESRWIAMKNELENPRNLDKLIKTHQVFLLNLVRRLFFDNFDRLTQKYADILDLIFSLVDKMESFTSELSQDKFSQLNTSWDRQVDQYEEEVVANYSCWLFNFSTMFHREIVMFLELLVDTDEDDLQELCFSIDFNKYYKTQRIK